MNQDIPELSILSGQDEVCLVRLLNGKSVGKDDLQRLSYSDLVCSLAEDLTKRGRVVAKAVQKKWKEGVKKTAPKPILKVEDIPEIDLGESFSEDDYEIEYEE